MNREEWLSKMGDKVCEMFASKGYKERPKKMRFSCSLPSRGAFSEARKVVGQCWSEEASDDQTIEILISPTLGNALDAASTLVHELVHVYVGIECGNGRIFRKCAVAVGLTGKMTETHATPELQEFLNKCINELGEYPHAKLSNSNHTKKKQVNRYLKLVCSDGHPEFYVRATEKMLKSGTPLCGVCHKSMKLKK